MTSNATKELAEINDVCNPTVNVSNAEMLAYKLLVFVTRVILLFIYVGKWKMKTG